MNLKNLKIGQRLALSFALVATLLIVISATSLGRIVDLGKAIDLTTDDRYPKIILAHTIKDELNETARAMRNLLLLEEQAAIDAEYASIAESSKVITSALEKLDQSVTSDKGRALMKELGAVRQRFLTERTTFTDLTKSGNKDEARKDLLTRARPIQLEYFSKLDQMIELQNRLMEESGTEADALVDNARILILMLSSAAILACIVITYLATRSITAPLQLAVGVARKVADGDLTSDIRVTSSDETGQLMQALKDMNAGLIKIVSQVRNGTESMASASGQIASGNMDLSSRTEQQASSLEETASSMEEMTSTVKQNGENARQANTLAASASQVAVEGGRVVAEVVTTMGAINESSKKIVDIIAVIDGIAFQTNILALNAAVEAARAGEQGRGFAVVASEVRNLAQRSAAAAKEIKVLIGDSVEKVDFGAKLVDQAGHTMQQIVESVQRVTDIMSEIAAASREQESGIDQINQAVTEMDTVTQQNAALVEEAAAAADALQEQAAGLASVVSVFQIATNVGHTQQAPIAAVRTAPVAKLGARRAAPAARPAAPKTSVPRLANGAPGDGDWESF